MARARLNRDQFFDKLARMDEADLKKTLWTLYWRGAAPMRERIEAAIDPQTKEVSNRGVKSPPDPELVLMEVTQFASLARSGSYLAGDRRVSRQERSRWRHTFRRLAGEAQDALRGEDVEIAAAALTAMIDLACEMRDYDYFRSEDPVEAARFVVSDAVAVLWSRIRQEDGSARFAERAAVQLLSWESRYGWTRRGDGWVGARETSLARVLSELLVGPDLWAEVGGRYLDALDRIAEGGRGERRGLGGRQQRAEDLSEWHAVLVERLAGSDGRSSSTGSSHIRHCPGRSVRSSRRASHASSASRRPRAALSSNAWRPFPVIRSSKGSLRRSVRAYPRRRRTSPSAPGRPLI